MKQPLQHTIVALDKMNKEQIFSFLKKICPRIKNVKIGMEVFYREGKNFIKEVIDQFDVEVFLDLKLHDIPQTVEQAIHSLKGLPIKFLTIHLSGGEEMVKAAVTSAKENIPQCKILGVTYLTSLGKDDLQKIWGIDKSCFDTSFENMINLGLNQNVGGFISSAFELSIFQKVFKEKQIANPPLLITPGIRFKDQVKNGQVQDQKRVADPNFAWNNGANYIVIGRGLTQAKNLEQRIRDLEN